MIVQLSEPKFKTKEYYRAISSGKLMVDDDTETFVITDLKCPNCGMHIGDKVMGADFYQPFLCPKCKGIFAFDLRCFRRTDWYRKIKERFLKESESK